MPTTEATPFRYRGPGIHSYNRSRSSVSDSSFPVQTIIRLILAIVGVGALGYYTYTLADERVYQAYGNWAFEEQIAGRPNATFQDYVREKTPFGFLAGAKPVDVPSAAPTQDTGAVPPPIGSIIGRVEIDRLHLSAVVRQGVDDKTLSDSVGHVPSTALPGKTGNFAIAAHRDTLFRVLKDIQKDDIIRFQSTAGTFSYKVAATKIVRPTDVSVLRPDGGGLIQSGADQQPQKLLTMITCYPFYFVGSAPKRFIVEAELVPSADSNGEPPKQVGMVK